MADHVPPRRAMTWAGVAFVVAALYFTREVCIPLALALLLSFLLGPLVVLLRRFHFGRVPSVIVAVGSAFSMVALITWLMATQIYDFAAKLPRYESNMHNKVQSFSKPGGGILSKSTAVFRGLSRELSNAAKTPDANDATVPATTLPPKPIPVEVHPPDRTGMDVLRNLITPLINPLITAGIVVVFVIFMLINREDLRDRLIRLVGAGQLNLTTQALDDAAHRVSRFLLAQLIVNICYGVPIGIALFFVGVPNPLLWGLMATLLRFIPYLGPWLAASMPMLLAFAVDPGWSKLLGTLAVFVVMELITYNFLEPWIYGSCTGISAVAILGAAVFWTWLWGPVGLLLSTPLTVCLVVLGRHVPHLDFLSVLLGDEPVLAPEARFYQRLLAMDYDEAAGLAEQFAKEHSIGELYEQIVIPALTLAEADRHRGVLDLERERFIFDTTRELIQELPERQETAEVDPTNGARLPGRRGISGELSVLCLPAADEADELAGMMLVQLLQGRGISAKTVGASALASERLELVQQEKVSVVCISAVPPAAVTPARYLCKRLRSEFPAVKLVVGIWQSTPDLPRLQKRLGPLADAILTSLSQALEHIAPMASSTPLENQEPHSDTVAKSELATR